MSTHTPSNALIEALREQHVDYELIPHRRTQSAAAVFYKTVKGGIASSVMRCRCPSASFMAPSGLPWTASAAVTRLERCACASSIRKR